MSAVNQPHSSVMSVPTITKVRDDVNEALERWYTRNTRRAEHINAAYGQLWQGLHGLGLAGGKRLRPYLTTLVYAACGGTDYKSIIQVGAGEELLHTSLLIHDDIIDRDTVRYGQPNITGKYIESHKAYGTTEEVRHFASGAALLAGDLALSDSYQLILKSNFPSDKKLTAFELLGEAIFVVAGGEFLDSRAVLVSDMSSDSLSIAELKTASYSVVSPLVLGATMADAPQDVIDILTTLGNALGTAYQLSDDLIGLFGDEEKIGKSITSDIREGKQTYLLQQILERCSDADKTTLMSFLKNPDVTVANIITIRAIAIQCGARGAVEAQIAEYAERAFAALSQLPFAEPYKTAFHQLITKMLWRES